MKTVVTAATVTFLIGLGLQIYGSAQEARPSFEVASVKPNNSGDFGIRFGIQPGGRFVASNAPASELIRFAYQVQPFQIVGAPGWTQSQRFDVTAKAEGDAPPFQPGAGGPPGPMQLMMQSLLEERFKLKAHFETREMPVYNLVMARTDGQLGEKLRKSAIDCAALVAARRGGGPGRAGGPPPAPAAGELPMCGMRFGPGNIAAGGISLTQFANAISPLLQRVVTDKTGLGGLYDIELLFTPDQLPQAGGAPPPGAPALPPIDPNGPTVFAALQEQLGLKLDAARGPVQVLVIYSISAPTPD